MQKSDEKKVFKVIYSGLLLSIISTYNVVAETYSDNMTPSIFNANSQQRCLDCHHSSLASGAPRSFAPLNVDFNTYSRATQNNGASGFVHVIANQRANLDGNMPPTGTPLNASERTLIGNWIADGAPLSAATAVTDPATSITKTTANLRGDFDTNVHANTTVPGSYRFSWGPSIFYGNNTTSTVRSSTVTTFNQSHAISGLSCGTTYNFRARATNGNGTGSGSNRSFATSACTAPVISEGASVSPAPTNEDTDRTFTLNRSDDDSGTLTWSVQTQGSRGTFTFDTPTTSSPVTVRYSPTSNQNGSDTAGRILVTNSTTTLTSVIIVNMDITPVNDQPSITSTASTSAIEGVLYSYQVVVDDPDDSFGAGLTISLTNAPGNMAVNSSGLITWTPINGDTTSGLVTVNVNDGFENGTVLVTQPFTATVTATNNPPFITSTAGITATEDIEFSYQVQVTDVDDSNNGTDLTFTLNGAPAGMAISATGLITWTPAENTATSNAVTITVEDGDEDNSTPSTTNNGEEIFTVSVTAVNDSPMITSTVAALDFLEEDTFSYQIMASDSDDSGIGTGLTASLTQNPAGMTVSNTGLVSWSIPRTAIFSNSINVTVQIVDGGEDGSVAATQNFTLTIDPPDTEVGGGDGVPDYSDNCPSVTNVAQSDNDSDTQYVANAGFPVLGDVDSSDPATGGDECDNDDDNDGMTDVFENMFAFLDPFDNTDATEDEDGDGVSNLDEFINGTSPNADSVGPNVTAPVDVSLDATGLLTAVELGTATGTDSNEGEVSLFKVALNETVADCNALSDLETDIESFRPGSHTITWVTCDSGGNLGSDDQIVNVKPLVSVAVGQSIGEGQAVSIDVVLNGDAIAYPATVDYTFAGTAVASVDHDGAAGTVTFAAKGEVGTIGFNTTSDGLIEDDETVIITLSAPFNIALSNAITHTVTITEANVAPQVSLSVTQPAAVLDVNKGNTLYTADGLATIMANATDGNGNALTYDWNATDPALFAAAVVTNGQFDFDPSTLTVDTFYKVSVTISDGQLPVTVDRLLLIKTTEVNNWLIGDDDDDDGVDNLAEGYGDEDGDGIPNYLDNLSTPANAIENQTVDLETSILIETNPGLHIALGEIAIASGATGILIGLQDIVDHGGSGGTAVTNAATDYTFLSSLLNFEVSGLTEAIVSVDVAVLLQSAVQTDAVVRKYNSAGWFDFVVDDLNEIRTAPGDAGTCPQPGSVLYTVGLTPGHLCVQLTIQDGGANDADGVRNFIVKDPGGLALAPEPEEEVGVGESSSSSSGRLGSTSLWFMLVFMMYTVYLWRRRKLCCVSRTKQ